MIHQKKNNQLKKNPWKYLCIIFGLLGLYVNVFGKGVIKEHCITVAVISINDFHAAFLPYLEQGIPGAGNLYACVDSLRKAYPYNLVVSVGDNFGGSYFSKKTNDQHIPWFFDALGIDLSVVGNHEFDNGQEFLAEAWEHSPNRPKDWHLKYLCANVKKEEAIPTYMHPFILKKITLQSGKTINVAFAGLLTATTPQQTATKNIKGLTFLPNYTQQLATLLENKKHKDLFDSAHLKIAAMHIATEMKGGNPAWSLPADSVNMNGIDTLGFDALLTAHSHKSVCGTLNNLPSLQAECYGKHVGLLRFEIDTLSYKVYPLPPVLCEVRESNTEEKRKIENNILHILNTTYNEAGRALGEKLTTCLGNIFHDRNQKEVISDMGGFVAESFAQMAQKQMVLSSKTPVVGVCHTAGIRNSISKGEVRVIDAGQVLPFGNPVAVFKMTGKEVKDLLSFGLNNKRFGWLQSSRLVLKVKKEREKNKLLQAYYIDPFTKRKYKIKDTKAYYVAADDFMTHGGDDYPESFFQHNRINQSMPLTSEAFFTYLQGFKTIDPSNSPRTQIIFLNE